MDADDGMDRLARKGLAEGLSDDEIYELLIDHDVPRDKAESILDDVKNALSTSEKNAREALADQTPDMSESSDAPDNNEDNDAGNGAQEKFEEAFAEEVDEQPSDDSSTTDEAGGFEELDTTPASGSGDGAKSFNEFKEDIGQEETSESGIFSKLTGLFSSTGDETEKDETISSETKEEISEEESPSPREQPPENPDWDAEALKELAREAIDKGLAEEEILSLFIDHGVPESYTKQLLENAKQERDDKTELTQQQDSNEQAEESSDDKADELTEDDESSEDSLEDLGEDSETDTDGEKAFEEAFEEDESEEVREQKETRTDSEDKTQSASKTAKTSTNQGTKGQKRRNTKQSSKPNVSAAKLDQETLQAMAQHGIAKGFDRDELVEFFQNHGVEKKRAMRVISTVLPSNNQNTQGRKKSEHEGRTETSEAKDAVAVQKQEQVTTAKDEDESFMSDMDKDQESLKVGRIYLTGRKPSYGRMRVRGLQDITGNEFESGGRTGFIDLSDTEEHIGGEEDSSADDSQQVGNDRIREQA
jgi:hypothetical protein